LDNPQREILCFGLLRFCSRGCGTKVRDNTTGITYALDRRGRQTFITQGAITTTRAIDDAGNLLSESYSGSFLDSLSIANTYDQLLRRTNLTALNASTLLTLSTFSYDAASRLHTVSDGTNSATYTYLANSPLVSQIDFATNGTVVMSTVKQYDNLNRLTSIASLTNSAPVASFAYRYNSADQRTAVTNSDSSYWLYTYDALGQVTSGRKYWFDGTPVAGQQFVYAFDDIGNRQNTGSGGNQFGTGLRYQQYAANNLNEYTQRTVPGYENVVGSANSNATVSLWAASGLYAPTTRKGEYFWGELPVNNSTGAVWLSLTNFAVLTNASNPDIETNIAGNEFLAATPEIYGYDLDGNLTNDGHWSYTWDAENRLAKMSARVSAGPQISLQFDYDSQGRRIRKQVWGNTGWSGGATNDLRFVYDAWNLIGELNTNTATVRTYMWGLDLSGTPRGAAGVAGLLAIGFIGAQTTNCFVAFDGNGDVVALANPASHSPGAQYQYGPFGEVICATGQTAEANPLRFSTKYQDDEADFVYYGYRYYSPTTGRWTSRDPIGLQGSNPLYGYVSNDPITSYDPDGRITVKTITKKPTTSCGSENVDFEFTLDRPPSEDGYVVQKIIFKYNYTDTEDTDHHQTTDFTKTYWEAWFVKGTKSTQPPSVSDHSHWEGKGRATGTHSSVGEIKFFYKRNTGDLGDYGTPPSKPDPSTGWQSGDGSSWSIGLPWTDKEPKWWKNDPDNGEASASRSVNTDWNCKCINKAFDTPVSQNIQVSPEPTSTN
jgi:RHS repeat-associated protein